MSDFPIAAFAQSMVSPVFFLAILLPLSLVYYGLRESGARNCGSSDAQPGPPPPLIAIFVPGPQNIIFYFLALFLFNFFLCTGVTHITHGLLRTLLPLLRLRRRPMRPPLGASHTQAAPLLLRTLRRKFCRRTPFFFVQLPNLRTSALLALGPQWWRYWLIGLGLRKL